MPENGTINMHTISIPKMVDIVTIKTSKGL